MGNLELVTWEFGGLGWGGCVREESAELQARFEGEMQSNPRRLLEHFDDAFRWTCCGLSYAEGLLGCDHHGDLSNPTPCKCDYCRSGVPVPDEVFNEITTHNVGLSLRQGPDPRSLSVAGRMSFVLGQGMGFNE